VDLAPPWPIRPKPQKGEVLSSWLSRIAEGYGLRLRDFRKLRLPKTPGYAIDIDSTAEPAFFEAIARGSLVPIEDVRRMGYAADEGLVYSQLTGILPEWIVPLAPNHHDSIPFCPSCLAADAVRHYRKRWRYAFAPVCRDHGLLTNGCPACGASYRGPSLGDSGMETEGGALCSSCLRRFRPTTVEGLDDRTLAAAVVLQDRLLEGVSSGWVPIGDQQLHVCMALRGVHDLAVLMQGEKRGPDISHWIEKETGFASPDWAWGSLESQAAPVRAAAIAQIGWLLGEWPDRLKRVFIELGLPASTIRNKKGAGPNWLLHPDVVNGMSTQPLGRSRAEIYSASSLLREKRSWPYNQTEFERFMNTGDVPPIQPLSRPVPDAVKDRIQKAEGIAESVRKRKSASREIARTKPREIYPALSPDALGNELLEDLDDATDNLTALTELRRKNRQKPTSG